MSGATAQPPSKSKPGGLLVRTVSAAVLIPPVLAAVYYGGAAFAALVVAGSVILALEWSKLCGIDGKLGVAMSVAAAVSVASGAGYGLEWGGWALGLGAAAMALIGGRARGWAVLGLAYVVGPSILLLWLRADPDHGMVTVFWIMGLVWASDIGGYAFGKTIGGPKLAPAVSPGKTWSGLAGAMLFAAGAGTGVAWAFGEANLAAFAAAAALGAVGQMGDLAESWVKRRFGVKDSGAIIPGHGGLLDRVDALLAVIAVVALATWMLGNGLLTWL